MEKNKAINYHRLLKQVIKIGGLLIECGAEIYRVEESIRRMLKAYSVESVDVFAIPSMIMVTLETPTQVSSYFGNSLFIGHILSFASRRFS